MHHQGSLPGWVRNVEPPPRPPEDPSATTNRADQDSRALTSSWWRRQTARLALGVLRLGFGAVIPAKGFWSRVTPFLGTGVALLASLVLITPTGEEALASLKS